MKHEVAVEGFAFALRPVRMEDAAFIVEVRANGSRSKYLHPISAKVEDQEAYLKNYFERENDYYFVVESVKDGRREGLVGIYDIENGTAEWGRWILKEDSLAMIESVFLTYTIAFEHLKLDELRCLTVSDNQAVVSFHDSCGLERRATHKNYSSLADGLYDSIEHALTKEDWERVKIRLENYARRIAAKLAE